MSTIKKLIKSAIVLAGTDQTVSYTPEVGEKVLIFDFEASAPQDPQAEAILFWDGSPLWSIQGDSPMPQNVYFEFIGDGIKKVELRLCNESANDYTFSAFAELEVIHD